MNTWARLPLPDVPHVAARFTSTEAQITRSRKRQWWQFWKPRRWEEVLASTPYALRVRDHVSISTVGESIFLEANGKILVRYPEGEE